MFDEIRSIHKAGDLPKEKTDQHREKNLRQDDGSSEKRLNLSASVLVGSVSDVFGFMKKANSKRQRVTFARFSIPSVLKHEIP